MNTIYEVEKMKLLKHTIKYILSKTFYILEKMTVSTVVILTIWAFLSWSEITLHNKSENPEYSDYNLIIIVMDAID